MLEIVPGQTLIRHLPVKVYRNLNKKGVVYSVHQRGKVVAYATEIRLSYCACVVSAAGLRKVRQTKVRAVHAWIAGLLTETELPTTGKLSYNPFKQDWFYDTETRQEVKASPFMLFNKEGVHYVK